MTVARGREVPADLLEERSDVPTVPTPVELEARRKTDTGTGAEAAATNLRRSARPGGSDAAFDPAHRRPVSGCTAHHVSDQLRAPTPVLVEAGQEHGQGIGVVP